MRLLFAIVFITASFFVVSHATTLRSYHSYPTASLITLEQQLSMEIQGLKNSLVGSDDPQEKRALYQRLGNRSKVLLELTARQYHLDQLNIILFFMSLVLLVVMRLRSHPLREPEKKADPQKDLNVATDPPREEYVEEWDFSRRITSGFRSKEEAMDFIKSDPMLNCDYCGAQLRSTFGGSREAVQLVTFYKAVPAGAKDMRVALGSYWFPRHASELRCTKCGRTVQR